MPPAGRCDGLYDGNGMLANNNDTTVSFATPRSRTMLPAQRMARDLKERSVDV
jgi:hypothetical protein